MKWETLQRNNLGIQITLDRMLPAGKIAIKNLAWGKWT